MPTNMKRINLVRYIGRVKAKLECKTVAAKMTRPFSGLLEIHNYPTNVKIYII